MYSSQSRLVGQRQLWPCYDSDYTLPKLSVTRNLFIHFYTFTHVSLGTGSEPLGIRQGCLLLPTLSSIFLERIMTDALKKKKPRTVIIGGRAIANLTFADNIDGLAEKEVVRLDKISAAFCMEITAEKAKLMNNNPNGNSVDIRINGEKLDEVHSFKYLGASRIVQITAALATLKAIWSYKHIISLSSKIRFMCSYKESFSTFERFKHSAGTQRFNSRLTGETKLNWLQLASGKEP